MLKKYIILVRYALSACCLLSSVTYAEINLSLTPFLGTGSTSHRSTVQQTSGISINTDIPFQIGSWTLGPRLELTNSFFSSKSSISNKQTVASYDHKFIATGLILRSNYFQPLKTAIFASSMLGLGRSESTVSQNTESSYFEYQNQGAKGSSFSYEFGTATQISNGKFNILFAVTNTRYFINQTNVSSSFEGNSANTNTTGFTLTSGEDTQDQQNLHSAVTHEILALKAGIQISI